MIKRFTLSDLIITIVVIGILALIILINVGGITKDGKNSALAVNDREMQAAVDRYHLLNNQYPTLVQPVMDKPQLIQIDEKLYTDYIKKKPKELYCVDYLGSTFRVINEDCEGFDENNTQDEYLEDKKEYNTCPEAEQAGYICIANIEDFKNINNNLSAKYILINDIDFSTETNWMPIGKKEGTTFEKFEGELNGNGYKFENYNIFSDNTTEQALFYYSKGSLFTNLTFADIEISTSVDLNKSAILNVYSSENTFENIEIGTFSLTANKLNTVAFFNAYSAKSKYDKIQFAKSVVKVEGADGAENFGLLLGRSFAPDTREMYTNAETDVLFQKIKLEDFTIDSKKNNYVGALLGNMAADGSLESTYSNEFSVNNINAKVTYLNCLYCYMTGGLLGNVGLQENQSFVVNKVNVETKFETKDLEDHFATTNNSKSLYLSYSSGFAAYIYNVKGVEVKDSNFSTNIVDEFGKTNKWGNAYVGVVGSAFGYLNDGETNILVDKVKANLTIDELNADYGSYYQIGSLSSYVYSNDLTVKNSDFLLNFVPPVAHSENAQYIGTMIGNSSFNGGMEVENNNFKTNLKGRYALGGIFGYTGAENAVLIKSNNINANIVGNSNMGVIAGSMWSSTGVDIQDNKTKSTLDGIQYVGFIGNLSTDSEGADSVIQYNELDLNISGGDRVGLFVGAIDSDSTTSNALFISKNSVKGSLLGYSYSALLLGGTKASNELIIEENNLDVDFTINKSKYSSSYDIGSASYLFGDVYAKDLSVKNNQIKVALNENSTGSMSLISNRVNLSYGDDNLGLIEIQNNIFVTDFSSTHVNIISNEISLGDKYRAVYFKDNIFTSDMSFVNSLVSEVPAEMGYEEFIKDIGMNYFISESNKDLIYFKGDFLANILKEIKLDSTIWNEDNKNLPVLKK